MEIINLVQGSPEWDEFRKNHYGASEAPAAFGASKYISRDDLLKQKKTGITPEITPQQDKIFARGHQVEADARPIAEGIIGEELFPVTGVYSEWGVISASMDGQTMLGDVIWEHKHINKVLRQCESAEDLPEMYKIQMDQQLLVSGAEKCLFMASDGTYNDMVNFWYYPDPDRLKAIIETWEVFEADLEQYEAKPESVQAVGEVPDSLPALNIKLTGGVSASNLAEFKQSAVARIESISTDLQTDEDFATAEQTVKFLKAGEKQLDDAKKQALAETASIEELFRTVDDLKEQMRQKRLQLDKLVKAEKENKKLAIAQAAKDEFDRWLSEQDSPIIITSVICDPGAAMKGKKTIKSLQSAADDAVAAAKVQAKQEIARIKNNAASFDAMAEDCEFLFPDRDSLLVKDADDLCSTVKARIADHKQREQEAKEKAEAEAKAKAEREAEEATRAEAVRTEPTEPQAEENPSGVLQAKFPEPKPDCSSEISDEINQWASTYGIQDAAVAALKSILSRNGVKI